MRVLFVDASESRRRAMRSLLEKNPNVQACGEAGDGQSAVEEFRKLRPDLVILDFAMPIENRVETALEISTAAPEAPLVLCTMYASEQVRKQALRTGMKASSRATT